jgi:hypothetical protein
VTFALGIKHSLKFLSFEEGQVDPHKTLQHCLTNAYVDTNKMFEENAKNYDELNAIVLEYGNLFRYALLIFKCFTLLSIYIVVHAVLTLQEMSTLVLYSVVTLSQLIRLLVVLFSLSFVQFESKKFKESWIRAFDFLSQSQKDRLYFIRPFGFVVGRLYVIVPSTILTFFSVMTTHVIVLLQVYSPKK